MKKKTNKLLKETKMNPHGKYNAGDKIYLELEEREATVIGWKMSNNICSYKLSICGIEQVKSMSYVDQASIKMQSYMENVNTNSLQEKLDKIASNYEKEIIRLQEIIGLQKQIIKLLKKEN